LPNGLFNARVKRILGPFINGLFYPYFQALSMTTADFVAACFWPRVILFAVLRNTVRDPMPLERKGQNWPSFGGTMSTRRPVCRVARWPDRKRIALL
jgi:hypothetical protein